MTLFSSNTYSSRRSRLISAMGSSGVILLPGNDLSPHGYQNNCYHFRQDSTFRYLFGLNIPSLVGLVDLDMGDVVLFGAESTMEDTIWSGALPSLAERGEMVGVKRTLPLTELKSIIAGRKVMLLPPYRGETKIMLSQLLDTPINELNRYYSPQLAASVALLREVKSEQELHEMELIAEVGYKMHTTAMKMAHEGITEHEIAGQLAGIAHRHGAGLSFQTICSQHGEILHNTSLEGRLERGRLLLVDAGAESRSGYASDNTRTIPVGGRFSDEQRDIYNIVLAAHKHTALFARDGVLYQRLQAECYRTLAEGLRSYGLLHGSMDEILESGAMRLFMPHGVSHGIGLDVHDCEPFGERSLNFVPTSDCCINRAEWRLRTGATISNEPGIYFIKPLIERSRHEGLYRSVVSYDSLEHFYTFGGIRIEDCLVITDSGTRTIGESHSIPKQVADIEAYMQNNRL